MIKIRVIHLFSKKCNQELNNNTVTIENEGWGNRVDFEIQIPAGFDISAETYNNGNIEIIGVKGEMNVESYNAPLR